MTDVRMVNYIVMFGISSANPASPNTSRKLFCYPSSLPQYEDSAIQTLSFLSTEGWDITDTSPRPCTHSFLVTRENGSKYYGASLVLFELANNSYCISNCIVLISDYPFYTSLLQYLQDIHNFLSSPNPILSLESYLYNIVNEVRFPCTDNILTFQSPSRTLHCLLPSKKDLPLVQLGYLEICRFLTPALLLKVLTCILLDYNILVISDNRSELNYFCEALVSLIYPFTWIYPFIPFLPSSSVEFLDAPLPFFIGWLTRRDQEVTSEFNLSGAYCQIDISTSVVKFSEQTIPMLPSYELLSTNLTQLYNTYVHSDSQTLQARQAQLSSLTELMSIVEVISNLTLEASHNTKSVEPPTPECRQTTAVLEEEKLAQLEFDCRLRELFYSLFLNTFSDAVKFVIKPPPGSISFTKTFDRVAFLSEKCSKDRDFLTQFFETQMFTTFIDDLIAVSTCDSDSDKHTMSHTELFQYHITHIVTDSNDLTYPMGTFNSTYKRYIERIRNSQHLSDTVSPAPREISTLPPPTGYDGRLPDSISIPSDDGTIQSNTPADSCSFVDDRVTPHPEPDSEIKEQPVFLSTATELTELLREASHKIKQLIAHHLSLTLRHHYEQDGPERACSSNVTQAILLNQNDVCVEDKGLTSNLIESLERIWSHECRLAPSTSLLWTHILAYKQNYQLTCQFKIGTAASAVRKRHQRMFKSSSYTSDTSRKDSLYKSSLCSSFEAETKPVKSASRRSSVGCVFNPLVLEVEHILEQQNIMTDIGRVRMWLKLLLEKRVLKERVEELLTLHSHISTHYQISAFLRTHTELEQLLYHLDSLSCVDFSCFSHDFPLSELTYSVSLSLARSVLKHTSALWLLVSGTMGRTDVIRLDKGSNFCSFSCRNIGHVLGVRIGHDNSGMNPDVFLHHIEVSSNLTGVSYFVCANRSLSDSQKDECVEHYFPAEKFSLHNNGMQRQRDRCLESLDVTTESMKTCLKDSIRDLIHYFTEPKLAQQSLTYLVLGESRFIPLLLDLLLYELLYSKHPYSLLWSLFSQIYDHLKNSVVESRAVDKFLTTFIKLEDYSKRCGPAEKIKVFLTIALSQGILHDWIEVMSNSKLTASFYRENSFLVNPELKEFLFAAVATLRGYQISVDSLFTLYMH